MLEQHAMAVTLGAIETGSDHLDVRPCLSAVGRAAAIHLHAVSALLQGQLERRQRVFRRLGAGASVRDHGGPCGRVAGARRRAVFSETCHVSAPPSSGCAGAVSFGHIGKYAYLVDVFSIAA